jgi:hypothetical protein
MPLLDHFHPPLFPIRRWESFHSHWAVSISADLNARLPKRFFAETQIHLGRQVEADVAEVELTGEEAEDETGGFDGGGGGGGTALLTETYAPPVVTATVPGRFPDDILVEIKDAHRDYRVVAVVELVSPSNKDRAEHRSDFVAKLTTYLSKGIGLIVADVVTSRSGNVHELWADVTGATAAKLTPTPPLYAVAYRPRMAGESPVVDVWARPLAVGQPLPELPLGLKGYGLIPLNLEATYTEARQRSGLG